MEHKSFCFLIFSYDINLYYCNTFQNMQSHLIVDYQSRVYILLCQISSLPKKFKNNPISLGKKAWVVNSWELIYNLEQLGWFGQICNNVYLNIIELEVEILILWVNCSRYFLSILRLLDIFLNLIIEANIDFIKALIHYHNITQYISICNIDFDFFFYYKFMYTTIWSKLPDPSNLL